MKDEHEVESGTRVEHAIMTRVRNSLLQLALDFHQATELELESSNKRIEMLKHFTAKLVCAYNALLDEGEQHLELN